MITLIVQFLAFLHILNLNPPTLKEIIELNGYKNDTILEISINQQIGNI